MVIQRRSSTLKFYPAPISFSFPVRERAVLECKSKHFVIPHQQHYKSKQVKVSSIIWAVHCEAFPSGRFGWALMIIQRQTSFLKFYPIEVLRRYTMLFHGNTIINRAKELAEIAANTFIYFYSVGVVRFAIFKINRLMCGIFTSNITKSAMNTFILVYFGDMMIIDIEIFPMRKRWHRPANKIIQRFETFFIHPVIETFTEIINNAETMFHHGRTHLHIACTEQHKLHRIFPC